MLICIAVSCVCIDSQTHAVPTLLRLAASQRSSHDHKDSFTVLTVGAINYKEVVLNWIRHLQLLKVEKYIIICTDKEIYSVIGAAHGVLVEYNTNATLTYLKRKQTVIINARPGNYTHRPTESTKETASSDNVVATWSTLFRRHLLGKPEKMFERLNSLVDPDIFSDRPVGPAGYNSSESGWIYDRKKAFSIMMYIKYSSILALLSAGHSVVWSDVDCVWVKMCAVNFLSTLAESSNNMDRRNILYRNRRHLLRANSSRVPHVVNSTESALKIQDQLAKLTKIQVDFASQQGASPYQTSDTIGTAICTGFFVVNPTPASLLLISAVQQTMISSVDGSCGRNCSVDDQSVVNGLLMQYGNLQVWAARNSKILYGPSYATNNRMEETRFLHTNLNFPRHMVAHEQYNQLSLGKRLEIRDNLTAPIVIGFLPYDLFPRGDARVNATALDARMRRFRARNNITNTTYLAPTKNKLMNSRQAGRRNSNEWNHMKEDACIWHMYSKKDGDTKVLAMIRDGVYLIDQNNETMKGSVLV
jgi:hypothetical protein